MKEIKFRAWGGEKMHQAFDLSQNPKCWWEDNQDYPLMQYSGLKDKNGVEIYEGDIVEFKFGIEKCRGLVKYDAAVARYIKEFTDSYGRQEKDLSSYASSHVVVGNIYENPELLGGSN